MWKRNERREAYIQSEDPGSYNQELMVTMSAYICWFYPGQAKDKYKRTQKPTQVKLGFIIFFPSSSKNISFLFFFFHDWDEPIFDVKFMKHSKTFGHETWSYL